MASRARVPSFSTPRIATPYTGRNKTAKIRANLSTSKKEMAVINWEHVLVPMSFLNDELGLAASIEMAVVRYQNSQEHRFTLWTIEGRIMELLAETMRLVNGPVFIVSEYPTSYVELVSSLFFPRLTAGLRSSTGGIYVVGTPNTQLYAEEMKLWKVNVLRTAVFEHLFAGTNKNVTMNLLKHSEPGSIKIVALCANETDVAAASTVQLMAPNASLKLQSVEPLLCSTTFYGRLQLLMEFVKRNTNNYSHNSELLQRRKQPARIMFQSKKRR